MSETEFIPVNEDVLNAVSNGWYHAPHDVLGPHPANGCVTIRAIRRLADEVYIETKDGRTPAVHEFNGIWRAVLDGEDVPDYRVVAVYGGVEDRSDDPYRFMPTVGEMDAYLFSEGRHEELWKLLGSHVHTYESELGDTTGASFAVWAPNAKAVRVVGDFNGWDGSLHSMRTMGASGIWEIFIPEAFEGARYKYEIQYADLSWHQKADPMARRTEVPPSTASIVTDSSYEWGDADWMERRSANDPHSGPITIYEMHLGSWRPGLDYRSIAEQLIGHVKYAGFTHVEFMPLAEHPFAPSWGYQVTGYYAPTSRFGTPDDLRYLIDELHKAGIGVIVDWVPAHFPKDEWALARFDGTPLYEDPNPLRGEHPDWGTYIFNFGRREVRNFLVANALYWAKEFHIDGIRVDAVASMLYLDYSREDGQWAPNVYGGRENLEAISFLQEATATAYRVAPGIMMMAEESTSWPGVTGMTDNGGLGFGLKWNMGWMNDTLRYLEEKPINRKWHHGEITFSLVYAFSEQYLLPLSHDEVVHGKGSLYQKMPGDDWQKLAGVRQLLAYQWSHPGKKLLFMGQEFAQIEEWNESRGLDWWLTDDPSHDGVLSLVKSLNETYLAHPALWEKDFSGEGFEWIDLNDSDHNVISYLRWNADRSDVVAVVCNFSGIPFHDYRVGLPFEGQWNEIVNTDAIEYGGSGVGNLGAVHAEPVGWNGRPYSAPMQLPPFGVVYFSPAEGVILAQAASEAVADATEGSSDDDESERPAWTEAHAVFEGQHDAHATPSPAHAPEPAAPVGIAAAHALSAGQNGGYQGGARAKGPAISGYPEHAPIPAAPVGIAAQANAEEAEARAEAGGGEGQGETGPADVADFFAGLPEPETAEKAQARLEALVEGLGVDLADPNLRMPGVLPPEPAEREPLGDYRVVDHDYEELLKHGEAEAARSGPDEHGIYREALTWPDAPNGKDAPAAPLDGAAEGAEPETERAATGERAAEPAPAPEDSRDPVPPVPDPDAPAAPAASATGTGIPPRLDIPKSPEPGQPSSLLSASASAAAAFLDAPAHRVEQLDAPSTDEPDAATSAGIEERTLIGEVLEGMVNGAFVFPPRNLETEA